MLNRSLVDIHKHTITSFCHKHSAEEANAFSIPVPKDFQPEILGSLHCLPGTAKQFYFFLNRQRAMNPEHDIPQAANQANGLGYYKLIITDLKGSCKSMGQKKCIEGIFTGETLDFYYFNLYSFKKKI